MAKRKSKIPAGLVLDMSGSMQMARKETMSGFNEYLEELQGKAGEVHLDLLVFNSDKMDSRCSDTPVSEVEKLTELTYAPAGMTPLYDAIGGMIGRMELALGKRKTKPLLIIMTDGLENASREWSKEMVHDKVQELEKAGWTVVFLGANQDSYASGQALGAQPGNIMNYDVANAAPVMRGLAGATAAYACSGGVQTSDFNEPLKAAGLESTPGEVAPVASPMTSGGHLSPRNVAEVLGIHPSTVRRRIARGDIPAKKVGGQYRVPRNKFQEWLDENGK